MVDENVAATVIVVSTVSFLGIAVCLLLTRMMVKSCDEPDCIDTASNQDDAPLHLQPEVILTTIKEEV